MKHLNFLSKSGSQSGSHSIVTLCTTVGSPSARRRGTMLKLLSVLVLIFTFGVGQMWGSSYSGSVAKVSSNGNQTISNVAWNITSDNTSGLGQNVDGTKGAQIGSGNKPTKSLTFETSGISGTITNVTVNTSGASSVNATVSVTVGTTAFKYGNTNNTSVSITSSAATYSFNGNASGTITISWSQSSSKALYVKSISVTYYPQTTITLNANGGSANKTATYDYGKSTPTTFTAVTRSNYTCTGYYTAASNGTKILNTNGSPAAASITVNSKAYTDSNSKWAYDGATLTLYAHWQAAAVSCETDPTVGNIMNAVSGISSTGATFSTSTGVSAGANCSLEEVGFVYGTSANPTTSNTKATITSYTSGALNKSVTGLEPNTTYYVRAYAINGHGTTYSDQKSFSTPELPKYTVSFVTGAGNSTQADITEASANAGITLPAGPSNIKCSADGWSFAGWSATNVASETSTAPTLLAAGSSYKPAADITLYAVYRKGSVAANATTVTYTLTGNWTTNNGNWTVISGELDGTIANNKYGLSSGSTSASSPVSIKDISNITFSGTASKTGAGTVAFYYGSGNSWTLIESKNFGTSLSWSPSPNVTGYLKCVFTRTAGNIYMASIGVTGKFPTYTYISSPDCCTELGSINGSVTMAQKSATLSWDLTDAQNGGKDHINSWRVEYKLSSDDDWTVAESTLAKATLTKTISDLNCNTDYDFRVSANVQSGYCDIVKEWTSQKTTKFTITKDETGGGGITLSPAATSVCDGDVIDVTANTPDGSHEGNGTIKVIKTGVSPEVDVTSTVYNSGTGKLTMPAYDITITATYAEKQSPSVGVTRSAISFGSPKKGASVSAETFNLTGSALTAGTLTLVAPNGYTVTPSSINVAAGTLSATQITVTPNTGTAGTFNGNISISGAGVSSTNIVALSMTVQETYTVNWYVNGTKIDANSKTDVTGTAVTAPSDFSAFTDCVPDFHFIGWKEGSAITGGSSDEKPTLVTPITAIGTTNVNYYAVFADGTPASTETVFEESLSSGISTTGWTFNSKCYTLNSAVRMSTGSDPGTMTSPALSSLDGDATLTFEVKAWSSTENGKVALSASKGTFGTTNFTTSSSDDFEEVSSTLSGGDATTTITFTGTAGYRISIKNVKVTKTVAEDYSMYYTTCPHVSRVTLSAAEVSNGSISFEQSGSAVTNVRTDGGADVDVDVVPDPATGYELTDVALSGTAASHASYDAGVITIDAGTEGALTATATFGLKDYTVTVNQTEGAGATLSGAADDAHYGETINLSATNIPANAQFINWTSSDVTITNPTSATGASFTMPAKDVTVTANFNIIHNVAWAIDNTPASSPWLQNVYVKGIVTEIEDINTTQYYNASYYISDLDENGAPVNSYYVYRGKNVGNTDFTNVNQLTEGDEVTIFGTLKTYSSKKEFDQNNYIIANGRTAASLTSVVVSVPDASLVQTDYYSGDAFSFSGFKATAVYNTGYKKDVTAAATFKANNAASYTVTAAGTVNVTATWNATTSANYPVTVAVTTKTLEEITLSETALTGYKGIALPKPATVTAHFDDLGVKSTENVTGSAVFDEGNVYSATSTSAQTIEVKYTFGPNTATKNYTVTLSSIENTLNTAYSVTEARGIIDLDQVEGNDLDLANNLVYVEGIITAKTANEITIKDVTDATKTIVLYKSTLGTGISSVDVNDRIKALGVLKLYNNTKYELDEDCEIVWKQPKVGITIANKTLEVGDVWTITATIDPAAAPVTYSIKYGSDDCVTLATNVITATAEGTATIIASAEAYDDGVNTYAANSKEFTITVNPAAVHTNVVLLAEYNGTYYALKNDASTVTVEMNGGMVVVANEATKNAIIWDRAEREGVATFKNGDNYLNANGSNDMTVSDTEVSWNWNSTYYRKGTDVRTFLYQAGNVNKIKYYAVSNAGNANYSNLPIIYTGKVAIKIAPTGDDPVTKDEDDVPSNASIVVSNKVTLEINNAKTLDNLTVEAGGTVSGSAALSVNDLTIKTNSGAFEVTGTSGQLTGSVMPVVSGDLYIEIKLRDGDMDAEASRKWYCISAPFNVNMNGGFFWGDGTPMVLNTDFQLFEWDGDRRAGGSSGWKRVSGTMKAGIAYFIGFDDERSNQNTIKLKAMSNTISNADKIVAPTHTGSAEAATYGNWNGLANPNFHHIALNKNVQAFNYDKQAYSPYATGAYNFVVGTPFFIQYAGDIAISAANGSNPYRAPKRESDLYSYCVRIGSASEAVADNQIYVRASETASAEYDSEREMITLNSTTSNYGALLWTVNYGGKRLAIEEAPFVGDKATYALSLYAPADGTYRIETPTVREDADLYLTYEGSIIWNLSAGAYEVELGKGATNEYGLMMVRKAPQVTTGVETIDNSQFTIHNCQKVILNDHVYILREGQLYDVTGKAVK